MDILFRKKMHKLKSNIGINSVTKLVSQSEQSIASRSYEIQLLYLLITCNFTEDMIVLTKKEASMNHYNVFDVVATMISCAWDEGKTITNLQIQKYLYYIQGAYIKEQGQLLFSEPFSAWPYGPVIHEVWSEYSDNSRFPIEHIETGEVIKDIKIKEFICKNMQELLKTNIWELVDKTHEELPWKRARETSKGIITTEDLFLEFSK